MGSTMTRAVSSTVENDGSVSDDPCQVCSGQLVLRRAPSGGWFLGCSKYPLGCRFKMAPNTHQMEKLELERAEKRALRAAKRAASDAKERLKKEEKERREAQNAPKYCEGCYSRLSNVDIQAGQEKHKWCK